MPSPLRVELKRVQHADPPAHHIVERHDSRAPETVGFQNPWDSWLKPSAAQVVQGLEWGERDGSTVQTQHASWVSQLRHSFSLRPSSPDTRSETPEKESGFLPLDFLRRRPSLPLHVEKPDFAFGDTDRARATWLGHAGVLVQLPSLDGTLRPFHALFDPIFSARCSPSQLVGPHRFFPAPCAVEDLPPIDAVFISHNHYDHLDYNTIVALWERFYDTIQFFVPLGNKKWFIHDSPGVAPEHVTEMDWWDEAHIFPHSVAVRDPSEPSSRSGASTVSERGSTSGTPGTPASSAYVPLRIVCTPAQHGSGRTATDAGRTLWSSWMLEHRTGDKPEDAYRVFFGGDSGYRFHDSDDRCEDTYGCADEEGSSATNSDSGRPASPVPSSTLTTSPTSSPKLLPRPPEWARSFLDARSRLEHLRKQEDRPPSPGRRSSLPFRLADRKRKRKGAHKYPACPAFAEVAQRIGPPDMLLLPISVGATFAYLKSFDVFPDWLSPFPRLSDGLTGANHMTTADAVNVFRVMTRAHQGPRAPVCLAIHWGTLVGGADEVTETIFRLQAACTIQNVHYARHYDGAPDVPTFALINHGESIRVP